MLLTVSTTHKPATDLGYLLQKHPDRRQSFDLSFGKAHVFYSEAGPEQCTACLLLDVDSVGMVRNQNPDQSFMLAQYVNDRAYAASSFMSVAISQVFGSALNGRCKDRPELAVDHLWARLHRRGKSRSPSPSRIGPQAIAGACRVRAGHRGPGAIRSPRAASPSARMRIWRPGAGERARGSEVVNQFICFASKPREMYGRRNEISALPVL